MLKRLWCTSSVLTNTVSSICCVAFASCHCWLKNSSDFIWLSTVKKGCILYKASIDWFISLHYPKIITSHRFVSYKFELGWPNYLKHFLKNTGWLHREENSSALIRQFTSVLPLACCTWWQEVGFAINPLLKPVILSNASSHSPDFKCNKFLQKLVFILFSSINFQAGTCRHTECQKVDKYPANRRKKQASLVELVVSSDCWSGDSPELPLGLKASPTKAWGTSPKLATHLSVQQQHQHSPRGCPADPWCKLWKTAEMEGALCWPGVTGCPSSPPSVQWSQESREPGPKYQQVFLSSSFPVLSAGLRTETSFLTQHKRGEEKKRIIKS